MAENQAMVDRSERRRPPSPKVAPWLVIPYGKGMKNQAFYNLCEPDNRTCRKLIPELSGKSFYQKPSHQGWLIVKCDNDTVDYTPSWNLGDCFLWNPATLQTIQLPSILYSSSDYTYNDYFFVDCVLSSPPQTSTNIDDDNDSTVFFLFERFDNEHDYVFLFCRPGDKHWRTQQFSRGVDIKCGISSLHYFRGNLYGMGASIFYNYKIKKVKIDEDDGVNLCIRLFETNNHTDFQCRGKNPNNCCTRRYVQTCDEFYKLEFEHTGKGKEVISVDITRLDFSLMKWTEVNSLGDNVIFYGQTTIACCSASQLGLTRGCLYYTLPEDQSLYKYDLEGTGTITLPCLKLPTPWFSSDWIMTAMPFRVGDGHDDMNEYMLHGLKEEEEDYLVDSDVIFPSSGDKNHRIICNNGEVIQQKPWSIINEDIIHQLEGYLHPLDYKEFRSVCKTNRSVLPIIKKASSSNTILRRTYVSPYLVYSITNNCTGYKFVDPMHNNENYLMKLRLLEGAKIRFQKGGWLLMSEGDCRLFFYNPFAKETIELPDLPSNYDWFNISFSSLPTCSDCVVCGIREHIGSSMGIYLIARGEKSWKYRIFDNIYMEHYMPALYDGILYCVDYNGLLGAFSLKDWSFKVLEKPRAQFYDEYPNFLVECGGDLILVRLGRIGKLLGVFKLDFSKMEWVRIKSLGKHMLFVSCTSCISRVAPNSDMENKIYFPRLSLHGQGILYYSLDTGNYHSLGSHHSSQDFYDSKGWPSWSWIEPNWSRSTVQELDWTVTLS